MATLSLWHHTRFNDESRAVELTLQAMKTLSELMDQALDLHGDARAKWIAEQAAGPNSSLYPHLVEMLDRQARMDTTFLVSPARVGGVAASIAPAYRAGSRVGPYVLQREIGQGGMGVVWLAARADGTMTRNVALKLPMLNRTLALADRFARERDILAQLAHPNIARLYDAGITDDGQPFLALEYVEGKPVTEHCDALKLSVRERLNRFLQVIAAVQSAHANLVIHRDLKPSNILVSDDGQVHLLDFGIAKLLHDPLGQTSETELTMLAGRSLTLDYASPEQLSGKPISTGSDVYSLGVVLYQLLTGQKPYLLKRGTRAELEEAILTAEPVRMSDAVRRGDASIAAMRALTRDRLARVLSSDLDTIVTKAMKKDAQQRYLTVAALGEDIQRHIDGLPVQAQADTWAYRASKFVLRNRLGVSAAAAVVAALGVGLGSAIWQANLATQQARRADAAAETARNEQRRADAEAATARSERSRADGEARAALASAARADAEASVARREAARADREAIAARQQAIRADQEAMLAKRETARGNAVQRYLGELFSANSNDQKNAVQVRSLNAKQLLDRGVLRLESAGGVHSDVDATLFRLFGNLYENLEDFSTAKRLHERSVKIAEATYGKDSKQYAMAILDLAWVEGYGQLGKRLDLIEAAQVILRRRAPNSAELAQALYYEAENVDQSDPARAAKAAAESIRMLESIDGAVKLKATAYRSLGHANRALGNFEAALTAYRRSIEFFTQLSGPDNVEVGETMGGVAACLRQLLRLSEAEDAAKKTVEILRPFDPEMVDAKVFGRALAAITADRGNAVDALKMLQRAYDKLRDSDGKPHALRSALSQAMANVELSRGDGRNALALAQRSRAELRSRTHSVLAAVLNLVARAALEANDLQAARAAIAEVRNIQNERGLPALSVSALELVSAELAAREGQRETALADFDAALKPSPKGAMTIGSPLSRVARDVSRSRLLASLNRWEEVWVLLVPWLHLPSGQSLPYSVNADVYALASEAAIKTRRDDAAALLAKALATIESADVSHSTRLQRLRALSGQ